MFLLLLLLPLIVFLLRKCYCSTFHLKCTDLVLVEEQMHMSSSFLQDSATLHVDCPALLPPPPHTCSSLFIKCLDALCSGGSVSLLHEVDLASRNCAGGNEGAMLGTDQWQVALSCVSTVLSCLELPLEAAHTCHALLWHAFLWEHNNPSVLCSVPHNTYSEVFQRLSYQLKTMLVTLVLYSISA